MSFLLFCCNPFGAKALRKEAQKEAKQATPPPSAPTSYRSRCYKHSSQLGWPCECGVYSKEDKKQQQLFKDEQCRKVLRKRAEMDRLTFYNPNGSS